MEARIIAAVAKRGEHAEADGALASTARWLLHQRQSGGDPDVVGAEAAAHQFGFGDVVLGFSLAADDTQACQTQTAPALGARLELGVALRSFGRAPASRLAAAER